MPQYIFTPEELQEAADQGAGLLIGERWQLIHAWLRERHPKHIIPEPRWIFNYERLVFCTWRP